MLRIRGQMPVKANYHTHTTRCNHAIGTDEEYVRAALEGGFQTLGFADHAAWPYGRGFVSGIRMRVEEVPEYVNAIRALRERYAGQLTIRIGLEAEYFPRYHDHLLRMREQGIGYYILGQHYADSEEDTMYSGLDCRTDDGVRRYAEATVKGICTGLYRYLAHPELFMRARYDEGFNAACEEATDMICQAAKEQGMPLEYNLAGLANRERAEAEGRPCRDYPCPAFWQYARKWGNTAIIGVDAHDPQALTDVPLWKRAERQLIDMGYTVIDHLEMED